MRGRGGEKEEREEEGEREERRGRERGGEERREEERIEGGEDRRRRGRERKMKGGKQLSFQKHIDNQDLCKFTIMDVSFFVNSRSKWSGWSSFGWASLYGHFLNCACTE